MGKEPIQFFLCIKRAILSPFAHQGIPGSPMSFVRRGGGGGGGGEGVVGEVEAFLKNRKTAIFDKNILHNVPRLLSAHQ